MTGSYSDTDFVYVDPQERKAVGLVEWSKNGMPKVLEMPEKEEPVPKDGEKKIIRKRRKKKRYYPWGTYRAMKRLYRLEGKEKEADNAKTFDEALGKALKEPYWD
jgi:hypothetical protein